MNRFLMMFDKPMHFVPLFVATAVLVERKILDYLAYAMRRTH